jgi:hypothetical protein
MVFYFAVSPRSRLADHIASRIMIYATCRPITVGSADFGHPSGKLSRWRLPRCHPWRHKAAIGSVPLLDDSNAQPDTLDMQTTGEPRSDTLYRPGKNFRHCIVETVGREFRDVYPCLMAPV